jgi:hypothetical protein
MVYGGQIERVSKHIFAKPVNNKRYCVDAAGIGGKNMPLSREGGTGSGEISDSRSWRLRSQQRSY